MPRANPNILLVEGDEDKRVIPFLKDEYVIWGNKQDEWVAEVRSHGASTTFSIPATSRRRPRHPAAKPSGSSSTPTISLIHDGKV